MLIFICDRCRKESEVNSLAPSMRHYDGLCEDCQPGEQDICRTTERWAGEIAEWRTAALDAYRENQPLPTPPELKP